MSPPPPDHQPASPPNVTPNPSPSPPSVSLNSGGLHEREERTLRFASECRDSGPGGDDSRAVESTQRYGAPILHGDRPVLRCDESQRRRTADAAGGLDNTARGFARIAAIRRSASTRPAELPKRAVRALLALARSFR
jgi:hypothetical protein